MNTKKLRSGLNSSTRPPDLSKINRIPSFGACVDALSVLLAKVSVTIPKKTYEP